MLFWLALGAWYVIRILRTWIDAPGYIWLLVIFPIALGGVLLWDSSIWYTSFGVAGLGYLVQRIEDLVLVKTDEGRIRRR